LRIEISIKLKNNELAQDYAPSFVSLIKAVLSDNDKTLFEKIYVKNEHKEKNFCFAVKLNRPQFHKDKIFLEDENIRMIIDVSDFSDGIDMYNAFVRYKNKPYPFPNGNMIEIKDVGIKNHKQTISDQILIKMQSPLLVRINEESRNRYISCNDEEFKKYFSLSVLSMLKNLYNIDLETNEIQIFTVDSKKTVVNTFGNKITGNIGTYIIKSHPDILNIISQTGIGSRRSQGFGCFDIISEVK